MDTQRFIVATKSNRVYEIAHLSEIRGISTEDTQCPKKVLEAIQKDKHGFTSWYMETPTGDATFYTVIKNSEIESIATVVQKPVPENS